MRFRNLVQLGIIFSSLGCFGVPVVLNLEGFEALIETEINRGALHAVELTWPDSAGSFQIGANAYDNTHYTLTFDTAKLALSRSVVRANIQKLIVPAGVTSIANNVFKNCQNLTEIDFTGAANLETIGAYAFYGTKVATITIPASVKKIYAKAFKNCDALATLDLSRATGLVLIGRAAFMHSPITTVSIPKEVKTVETKAFKGCTALRTLTFDPAAKIEDLGDEAFMFCVKLTGVKIPNSVKNIGVRVFKNCIALVYATLGTGMKEIPGEMFANCIALNETIQNSATFTLLDAIVIIRNKAFVGCTSLQTVDLANCRDIGQQAFAYCSALQTLDNLAAF
jgi:hypothetical protein